MTDDESYEARPRLRQLREGIARLIPCMPEDVRPDLLGMDLPEVLLRYLSWADRHVAPRPRRVVNRDEFLATVNPDHTAAVSRLCFQIEAGDDLKPYLSDQIDQYGYVRPRTTGDRPRGVEWGDKDYALNNYDTHHLHLGERIRADGWSDRTRALLYVTFSRDEAFLVLLGDHASFDNGVLAQAVGTVRVGTGYEIRGVVGISTDRSDRERNTLQRYGISTIQPTSSGFVMGGMTSTMGISTLLVMHSNRCIRSLRELDPKLDDADFGKDLFDQLGKKSPNNPVWSWGMDSCDLILVEETTATGFRSVLWRR